MTPTDPAAAAGVHELSSGDYLLDRPGPDPLSQQTAQHVRDEADRDRLWSEAPPPCPDDCRGVPGQCDHADPAILACDRLIAEAEHCDPPCAADTDTTAAADGFADAARVVARQYAAGLSLDTMAAYHDDLSTDLASDAQTSYGRAYAAEYATTARTLIADLRADVAAARTARPAPGTPHPDRDGWIADHTGVYVHERGELAGPQACDREAC
jgi:Manganese containing catalase